MPSPKYEQPSLLDSAEPAQVAETIEALERLDIFGHEVGFYPPTREELNMAFNVRTFIAEPGGAARHLAEVSRHQEKYNASPVDAPASITRDFATFARKAKTDETFL